ncbi:MAG: hypothetical protein R2827_00415 [Bdellovibrionales bacterium]
MLKLQLKKNLRRSVLQGQPWIYRDALTPTEPTNRACLAKLHDHKGQFLSWVMADPHSVIGARVISTSSAPPNENYYRKKLETACLRRAHLQRPDTDSYRLINGEGDGLPGLVCDIYSNVAVLQTDGIGPYQFWDLDFLSEWILSLSNIKSVYFKPRRELEDLAPRVWGEEQNFSEIKIVENGCSFFVDAIAGQKTGFF